MQVLQTSEGLLLSDPNDTLDVPKNNQIKNSIPRVPDTESRAYFQESIWSPLVEMQQSPLGISQLIMGDSLVSVLHNLRTLCIITEFSFEGATVAQKYTISYLMNPRKIVYVTLLVGRS